MTSRPEPCPARATAATLSVALLAWLQLLAADAQAARDYAVIGDSLSQNYSDWFPAYYPEHPESWDTRNWSELLDDERGGEFQMVSYDNNVAVPGWTAAQWADLLDDDDWWDPLGWRRDLLNRALDDAERAIVWVGGNDADAAYGGIYDGGDDAAITETLDADIKSLVEYVLARRPGIPVVLVAVPHVGIAPEVQSAHPTDPVKTARVTRALDELNDSLRDFAAARGVGFADIYSGTRILLEDQPYYLGGREFLKAASDDAEPRYLFTGDGFHPGEAAHAVFANRILEAINAAAGDDLALFTQRELLDDVLEIGFVDHFAQWSDGHGLPAPTPFSDSDGDSVADLVEFAFLLDPTVADAWRLPAAGFSADANALALEWSPNPSTFGQIAIRLEESDTLGDWKPVPPDAWTQAGDSFSVLRPLTAGRQFLRFVVSETKSAF